MKLSEHRRESRLRGAFPPAMLLALLWAGVQILLLLYFRVVLLHPTGPVPSLGEFMGQIFGGSSAAGPALATVLFVVNALFVGLIWLKSRSVLTRSWRLSAILTNTGVTLLLVYLQWKWLELLRSAFQ